MHGLGGSRVRYARNRRTPGRSAKYFLQWLLLIAVAAAVVSLGAWADGAMQEAPAGQLTGVVVASTGSVQGSTETLVRYPSGDTEEFAIVPGGPYFEGDSVTLSVDGTGNVISNTDSSFSWHFWLFFFLTFVVGVKVLTALATLVFD